MSEHHTVRAVAAQSFETMDAIRGIGAMFIVAFHLNFPSQLAPHTYLGVDTFCVLSGFVIAHAYDSRFQRGLSVSRFLTLRWLRLFPLLLVTSCVSLAVESLHARPGPPHNMMVVLSKAFGQLLAFRMYTPQDDDVFDLNPALWTLEYELVVNALYALSWSATRRRLYAPLLIGAGIVVAGCIRYGTLDFGVAYPESYLGFGRVLFAFYAGVWIRRWAPPSPRRSKMAFVVLAAFVGAMMLGSFGSVQPVADALIAIVFCPLLVLAAARWTLPSAAARFTGFLGAASYAVYVIHQPLYVLLLALYQRRGASLLRGMSVEQGEPMPQFATALVMLSLPLLCYALHHWYDEPFRNYVRRALERRWRANAANEPLASHPLQTRADESPLADN